jgi:hypothetical protein
LKPSTELVKSALPDWFFMMRFREQQAPEERVGGLHCMIIG